MATQILKPAGEELSNRVALVQELALGPQLARAQPPEPRQGDW